MQNLAVADRQHPHIGAGHLSRNILVDEFQEAEELCARTIQSIQYLASHVPTSVLKRLHIETLAQLEEERNQEWNTFDCSSYKPAAAVQEPAVQPAVLFDQMSIKDATKLRLMGRKRRNSLDRDSTENSSVISELSNVSQDGDSDDEGSPKDSRYPLQFDLGNRSHVELNALALHDSEPDLCSRQESLYVDHLLELATEEGCENRQDGRRPPRRRNRGATRRGSLVSQVSQVSILSHRYFNDAPSLPYASKHDSALLFVDISGFTQLSTLLDPESLSRAINNYFQLIVNEVTQHHGDIIKFAGDALYAEWKVSSNRAITSKSIESNVRMNLEDCVTAAAICGAKLVKNYCRHPIKTSTANPGVASQLAGKGLTLNVHCGISVGELVSVHFGDDKIRRENVVLGKAINDVSDAAMHAGLGEVAACPESIRVLSRTCKLDSTIDASNATEASVIADQSTIRFSPREEYTARYANKADSDPLASRVARLLHGWDSTKVVRFRKLLSLYAHPVVEANDAADFDSQISLIHLDERQVEEAELRNVFVMFIAPQISVSVTGNDAVDSNLFNLLNSVMNLVTTELSRFGGQLRQYIVDDKGLVLIATFGLRGSTFPNMVSEWALPSASSIHGKLQTKLGVQNRIGATVGNAYCGVVGGLMRHEYAVLGPSVNLAARLMVSDENPGILVDDSIRVMACKSYGFRALEAIKAKGYAEHVPIFEPLTPLQRRWGHTEPHFVGRGKELLDLKGIACGMAHSTAAPSKLVLISGVSGVGKSTLVVHAIDKIKEAMHVMKKRIFTRST
jgi:class 3 adenylate cyclase